MPPASVFSRTRSTRNKVVAEACATRQPTPRTRRSAPRPREARTDRRGRAGPEEAQAAVVARLDDQQFMAGFGSNGGEEFLSYMNIAESLVVKGGEEWKRWDSG